MAFVSLTNPGLIPMEAVTTMGVSAKDGEAPIGMFGTGLKYAIACLLRTGQRITIWRGLDRYDFAKEAGEVRGKGFDFIYMTGPEGRERLGFTTHLGAHWETWQVFRELYANCLDEGGDIWMSEAEPAEDHTTIWIEGAAFAEAAQERERYFLQTQPLYKNSLVEVHPGESSCVYYRGVLVARLPHTAAFTYNLVGGVTLTEDRTLKDSYVVSSWVTYTLGHSTDRAVIAKALLSQGYEKGLTFGEVSEEFAETALELCERKGAAAVVASAVTAAEVWAQREARVKPVPLTKREADEIEAAKAFLARIGFPVTHEIVVAETLGPDVFGMARNEKIYLSRLTLNRGGNFLIGTILEEHLHLTQGLADESRGFQDFLIDLVVKFAREADTRPAVREAA
ncbi:hypothetical protein [Phenylobacterium sp.]|uniref:hypothetical protein n=1 Tax=Phenylobacterium sp. TaxID=1871053 RepID=UPI003961A813